MNGKCQTCSSPTPPSRRRGGGSRRRCDACTALESHLAALERAIRAVPFPDTEEGEVARQGLRTRLLRLANRVPPKNVKNRCPGCQRFAGKAGCLRARCVLVSYQGFLPTKWRNPEGAW